MQRNSSSHGSGFTLIEVLVSILILGVVMAIFSSTLLANTGINSKSESTSDAIRIGEMVLEKYRQRTDYSTLYTSQPITETIPSNGKNYIVTSTFCSTTRSSDSAINSDLIAKLPCSSRAVYIDISVSQNNKVVYKAATYFTKFGKA